MKHSLKPGLLVLFFAASLMIGCKKSSHYFTDPLTSTEFIFKDQKWEKAEGATMKIFLDLAEKGIKEIHAGQVEVSVLADNNWIRAFDQATEGKKPVLSDIGFVVNGSRIEIFKKIKSPAQETSDFVEVKMLYWR